MFRVRTRLRAGFAGGGGGVIVPTNTVAPAITGNAYVGSTLTCSTGTWLNNPLTYSYQWKRGVTNVGTDQNTYVPVTGDIGSTITCTVTATNSGGSASQVSNTTAAVIGLPVNTVAPAVTGTAQVGQTLTTTTGTWTGGGSITYSYQWVRNPSTNVGSNQNTYVPVSADIGSTIRCVVTASNAAGADQANSNNTAAVTTNETWQVMAAATPDGNSVGWSGYTIRQRIDMAQLAHTDGSQVRVTLKSGLLAGFVIDDIRIGEATGATGGDYSPTGVLLFGASTGVTCGTDAQVISDGLVFDVNPAWLGIVIAFHFSGASAIAEELVAQTGWTSFYKNGNDVATPTATGYTTSVVVNCVAQIEAFAP